MHGELVCFGSNSFKQCDVPAGLGSVRAVSAGSDKTCAVTLRGDLICFGHGSLQVPADLEGVEAVSVGVLCYPRVR